jgi:2-keto-4-pentenoate hydratase/2-oxohepta-3-ene-1,7-dioic acid hydratase in catechol pathway
MKLVTFAVSTPVGRMTRLGALVDGQEQGRIADLTTAFAAYLAGETDEARPREIAAVRTPPDMIEWLEGGRQSREAAEQAVGYVRRLLGAEARPEGLDGARLVYERADVRLLAPLPRPRSIRDFSVFEEHMSQARGIGAKLPKWYRYPPYYKGNPGSVIGPEEPIPYPNYTEQLDCELEIGIVIGREGRNLRVEEARDYIAGYTIFVDCSAREVYQRSDYFGPAKTKDFCNVLGPCLTTADEIDEANLHVRLLVDGEEWYAGNTGHRRHYLAEHMVAFASDHETLYPGDVLGTGTVGLSCSMDTHRWVQVGQTISFEVEGIGTLSHLVVPGDNAVDYVLNGMPGLLEAPSTTQ